MALAKLRPVAADTHHGIPIFDLRVDEPIPSPRAPERYAIRVYPDLARYLLTFNHPNNRREKKRRIGLYGSDMRGGLWMFTPESIIFSRTGVLLNGQNRLRAIETVGIEQWLMFDFGWPDELIGVLDRGQTRNNSDALHILAIPNSANVAALVANVSRYDQVVGQTRGFGGLPIPSAAASAQTYEESPEAWQAAVNHGRRIYDALDKAASPTIWSTAAYVIARSDPEAAVAFLDEVRDGTGKPGSATRVLADWFRRRPAAATRTGDDREPLEIILRAYNAWKIGKSFAFPRQRGFALSRPR